MPVQEAGRMDWQTVKPLHQRRTNVIGLALESVRSRLEVTGRLLRQRVTRRSVQVHLVFGVPGLRVAGRRDPDQNRCPGDSILSFAMWLRLRGPEHAPKQRSRSRQNPTRENSRRSRSVRRLLALLLLSTRIRSWNRSHKLNQPVAQL